MAEIINLNKARKARVKEHAKDKAVENRVRFGRTKIEKVADRLVEETARKKLDDARLNSADDA